MSSSSASSTTINGSSSNSGGAINTTTIELIQRLAEKIYDMDPWLDATRKDIAIILQNFHLLEANDEFITALVKAVWDINMRIRAKGQVKRILLPVTSEQEKDLLFDSYRIRGAAAYLKVRFYDRQEDDVPPTIDMNTYYATLGVILVPAIPPLDWQRKVVNEFTRELVIYPS